MYPKFGNESGNDHEGNMLKNRFLRTEMGPSEGRDEDRIAQREIGQI